MDFIKNIIKSYENKLCFLCFKKNEDLESISKNLNIQDEDSKTTSSIRNMMMYLFPSCEILFEEVCMACSNLILSMYLKLRRYEIKKMMYTGFVNTLLNDAIKEIPINKEPYKLCIEIPNLYQDSKCNRKIDVTTVFEEDVKFKFEQLCEKQVIKNEVSSKQKTGRKGVFCAQKMSSNKRARCGKLPTTLAEPGEQVKKINVKNNATICHKCGKDCGKPNALRSHLNCHQVKACPYCSKILKTHSHFKIHVKSHEGIKKVRRKGDNLYYCNDCEYSSLNKCSLQAHINKYHLQERPFVCEICSKGFYKKSNLTEHILTHTNAKNLTCEECGENFVHKKTLMEHLRLHSGEKPFQCSICKEKFVTSGRRSDHLKRKHGDKNECCDFCGKKYSLKKDLNRHIKTVHVQTDSKLQFFQTNYEFLDDNGDVLPVLSSI